MRTHSMRNGNQILHGIKLGVRVIFTVNHAPMPLAKVFGDTNADARSVCGSWFFKVNVVICALITP